MLAITSAIQIVADLETPTRQCTSVAEWSAFPRPAHIVGHQKSKRKLRSGVALTNEFQTPLKLARQWIDTIILHSINHHQILPIPLLMLALHPANRLSNAQNPLDAHLA